MDLNEIPKKLRDLGRSQAALARHLNLDPSSLTKTLKGTRKLTADELIKIEEFFGESVANLNQRGARGPLAGRRIPVFGYAAGGDDERIAIGADQVLDYVDASPFWNGSGDLFMVRVIGESMEPRYFAGERAPVRRGLPPARGADCLVELTDGSALLKVFRGMKDGILFLGQYQPADREIRIELTKVRGMHTAGLAALT